MYNSPLFIYQLFKRSLANPYGEIVCAEIVMKELVAAIWKASAEDTPAKAVAARKEALAARAKRKKAVPADAMRRRCARIAPVAGTK